MANPSEQVVAEFVTRPPIPTMVRPKARVLKKQPSENVVVVLEKVAGDMVGGGAIMEFNTKIRPAAPEPSEPRERAAAGVVDPALDKKGRKHLLS